MAWKVTTNSGNHEKGRGAAEIEIRKCTLFGPLAAKGSSACNHAGELKKNHICGRTTCKSDGEETQCKRFDWGRAGSNGAHSACQWTSPTFQQAHLAEDNSPSKRGIKGTLRGRNRTIAY